MKIVLGHMHGKQFDSCVIGGEASHVERGDILHRACIDGERSGNGSNFENFGECVCWNKIVSVTEKEVLCIDGEGGAGAMAKSR